MEGHKITFAKTCAQSKTATAALGREGCSINRLSRVGSEENKKTKANEMTRRRCSGESIFRLCLPPFSSRDAKCCVPLVSDFASESVAFKLFSNADC